MYEFWYDYLKPKYGGKVKLPDMNAYSFNWYVKRDAIYKDITEAVETRFDTSNYELQKLLPEAKIRKR